MIRFRQYLQEVAQTKRVGIQHIEKMKPLDFIALMNYFKSDLKGVLSQKAVKITEKVDGAGFRMGVDEKGKFFIESSHSGPQFTPGSFTAYAKTRGGNIDIAGAYDDVFKRLKGMTRLQSLLKKISGDKGIKVIGEMMYNPVGDIQGSKIKFVATNYDRSKLGKLATFVLFAVVDGEGKEYPDQKNTINLFKEVGDENIKFEDPSIDFNKLDVTLEVKDFFKTFSDLKEIERVLQSRKHVDREPKKALVGLIGAYQEALGKKLINNIKSGKFGDEFEGLVFQLASGKSFKVVTQRFKKERLKK